MTTIDFDQLADDYLDGTLSGSEWQKLLDEHGETLHDAVKRAEAVRDTLRSLPRPQLPADVRAGIGAAIAAIAAPPAAARKPLHWTWQLGAPLAAAAALIIAVMVTQQEQERALERDRQSTYAEPQLSQRKAADNRNGIALADAPAEPAAAAPAKPSAENERLEENAQLAAASGDDSLADEKGAAVGMAQTRSAAKQAFADAEGVRAGKEEVGAKPQAPAVSSTTAAPVELKKQLEDTDLAQLEQEARRFNKDAAAPALARPAPAPGPLALALAMAPNAVDKADEPAKSKLRLDARDPIVEITLTNRTVGDVMVKAGDIILRGLDEQGKPIWSTPVTGEDVLVPAQQQVILQKSLADTQPPAAVAALVVIVGSDRSEPLSRSDP